MSGGGEVRSFDCRRAADALHRRLDGEVLERAAGDWLASHLRGCAPCRRTEEDLARIHATLAELPVVPLPDAALEEVWDRTIRAPRPRRALAGWSVAAAAVLALALVGLWTVGRRPAPKVETAQTAVEPSPAELERATAELRFALGVTAAALQRGERAAFDGVLGRRVAPALGKIPMQLPGTATRAEGGKDDV